MVVVDGMVMLVVPELSTSVQTTRRRNPDRSAAPLFLSPEKRYRVFLFHVTRTPAVRLIVPSPVTPVRPSECHRWEEEWRIRFFGGLDGVALVGRVEGRVVERHAPRRG